MILQYRAEVDGLRAVAIVPVVLYHAGIQTFAGGFTGVDVFFVISGYLITSIILIEKREGRFSLTGFYGRRIRRIFPAFFVMMAACYPLAVLLLGPSAMEEFSGSFAAATVSVANVYFLGVSGYFATAAELKPLLHTWSLSVEEQFYVIFPAVLLMTWRLGPRRQMLLFAIAAAASIGLAQWQIGQGENARAFFLLQSRFWELLVGVGAAYRLATLAGQQQLEGGWLRHLALLGLALICLAVFGFSAGTPFPGLAALVPCAGAALVILFASPQGLVGKALGSRPMVFLGLISYPLYLWHYPLLAFARVAGQGENRPLLLAACLMSVVLAFLSWRYVERPVRRMSPQPPIKLFGTAAAGVAILLGLGMTGYASEGYRQIYLNYRMDPVARQNYQLHRKLTKHLPLEDSQCQFSTHSPDSQFLARFEECAKRYGKGTFILGDSHSVNVFNALRDSGHQPFIALVWEGGCRPFVAKAKCPYEAVIPFLEKHGGSISQVVFHVSGSHLILDHLGKDDSPAAFLSGNGAELSRRDAELTADYISRLPDGPDKVWLGPFAEARVDLDNPENYVPERLHFNEVSLELFSELDRLLQAVSGTRTGFRYVSLVDALDLDRNSLKSGNCITFVDQDHMSRCGEALFGPAIAAALVSPH